MSQGPTLDPQRARELLPWLLNRTLEESERNAVLDTLRTDPALRRELAETHWAGLLFARHLPTADVVAYAFGEATETDRSLVESHLSSCSECRDELSMVRASLAERDAETQAAESAAADVVPFARPAASKPQPGANPAWRALAMAAGLAAVLGLGGWLTTWQQTASQRADLTARAEQLEAQVDDLASSLQSAAAPGALAGDLVGAIALSAGPVRAASDEVTLVLSATEGPVEFRMLPLSADNSALYELRLLRPGGEELLRITPLTVSDEELLLARVDAEHLPDGPLTAKWYRLSPRQGWEEVGQDQLRVERQIVSE